MGRKNVLLVLLLIFIVSLLFALRISYSRYTFTIESNPIIINTKTYSNLTITNVAKANEEENKYIITVSNSNDYEIVFKFNAVNSLNNDQELTILQYAPESQELVNEYTIPAKNGEENSELTISLKIEKNENIEYQTNEENASFVIPVALYLNAEKPYNVEFEVGEGLIENIVDRATLPALDSEDSYDIVPNTGTMVIDENAESGAGCKEKDWNYLYPLSEEADEDIIQIDDKEFVITINSIDESDVPLKMYVFSKEESNNFIFAEDMIITSIPFTYDGAYLKDLNNFGIIIQLNSGKYLRKIFTND